MASSSLPHSRLLPALSKELPSSASVEILRCEGKPVVIVRDFLAAAEAAHVIDALRSAHPAAPGKVSSQRRRQECKFVDDELTQALWSRLNGTRALSPGEIGPLLDAFTVAGIDAKDGEEVALLGGTWRAHHLLPRTTFSAYGREDFFGKHMDLRVASELPSFLSHATMVIYLNELGVHFTGGTLNICETGATTETQVAADGTRRELVRDRGILHHIAPTAGMAVLFLQEEVEHEGGLVLSGDKYILRTDIMFERVGAVSANAGGGGASAAAGNGDSCVGAASAPHQSPLSSSSSASSTPAEETAVAGMRLKRGKVEDDLSSGGLQTEESQASSFDDSEGGLATEESVDALAQASRLRLVEPSRTFLDDVLESITTPGAGPGLIASANGALIILLLVLTGVFFSSGKDIQMHAAILGVLALGLLVSLNVFLMSSRQPTDAAEIHEKDEQAPPAREKVE